jgi:uncharacterized protein DUF6368
MGGPSVSVVLGVDPAEDDRRELWNTLQGLGKRASEGEVWPDLWIRTTRPVGGSYDGEGRPFGVRWKQGEDYAGEDEDFPAWHKDIAQCFGFLPQSRIFLEAGCSDAADHRIMGELVLYLARSMHAAIDLHGELIPASSLRQEKATDLPWLFKEASWSDVAGPVERFFKSLPGKIFAVPYPTAGGRTWVTHVCDAEFMEAWLRHPEFHMIK